MFRKPKPKIGPPHRRQVVHPWPQTPQGESVAEPGTVLLIVLSLQNKFDIMMVHCNLSNLFVFFVFFFKKEVCRQKHPRKADKCRNNISYVNHFILSKYCQHPLQETSAQCIYMHHFMIYILPHYFVRLFTPGRLWINLFGAFYWLVPNLLHLHKEF